MSLKKQSTFLAAGLLMLATQVHAQELAPPSLPSLGSPAVGSTSIGSLNSGVPDRVLRGQPDPSFFPAFPEISASLVEVNIGNTIANGAHSGLPALPGLEDSDAVTREANTMLRPFNPQMSALDQSHSARGTARARANRSSGVGSLVLRMQ